MILSGLRKTFRKAAMACLTMLGLMTSFNARAQRPAAPDDWKFTASASHAFSTHYANTNVHINTSRYNLTIDNYDWESRNQNEWMNPQTWFAPGHNIGEVIHEPPNTYTLAWEKNNNILFVSSFHLKYLQGPDQMKRIHGTMDGVAVDHVAPIEKAYDPANPNSSGLDLIANQNTYMSLEFEAGYAHRFVLRDLGKFGTFSYVPGVGVGIATGITQSTMRDGQGGYYDYNSKYGYEGFGGSIHNKIEWRTPNDRFGIFYDYKAALYFRQQPLLDGKQTFTQTYTSNSFGMTFTLYDHAKWAKKKAAKQFGCP